MDIQRQEHDGTVELKIRGSLSGTQSSAIQLFETISIEVGKKPSEIILNLEELIFIDSMSIGLVVGSLLKCKEHDIGFRIVNIPGHLIKIFDATNLKKLYEDLY